MKTSTEGAFLTTHRLQSRFLNALRRQCQHPIRNIQTTALCQSKLDHLLRGHLLAHLPRVLKHSLTALRVYGLQSALIG